MKPPKKISPRKDGGKSPPDENAKRSEHPFRSAVIRGLGVVTPPLLTIVIFLWVGSTVQQYVLRPITIGVRDAIVMSTADIRPDPSPIDPGIPTRTIDGETYRRTGDDKLIPIAVYDLVRDNQVPSRSPSPLKGSTNVTSSCATYNRIKSFRPFWPFSFWFYICWANSLPRA